jgi:penicillin-binding protein 1C
MAVERRYLTAASLIDDLPVSIDTPRGLYLPQDYDRDYKGAVSVRTALAASLNVPAVRTLMLVGVEAFRSRLVDVGYTGIDEDGSYYGYALALGSADVSLWEQATAYRTLALGGRSSPLRLTMDEPVAPLRPVMPPAPVFIVGDMLSDPSARSVTFGLSNSLAAGYWAAVKTGTSKDMRDNWALGYSEHYTVGVWVGNANGAPMWDVSGTTGAAPVWAEIMSYLHREKSSQPAQPPRDVISQTVELTNETGKHLEAPHREWFIQGTEQALFTLNRTDPQFAQPSQPNPTTTVASHAAEPSAKQPASVLIASSATARQSTLTTRPNARIVMPTQGTILALDPDIPDSAQHVALKAEQFGAQHSLHWTINDKALSSGEHTTWQPWPGLHDIALVNDAGIILDRIKIEVRGAVASKDFRKVPESTK